MGMMEPHMLLIILLKCMHFSKHVGFIVFILGQSKITLPLKAFSF
jgi:hypothetical protein